MWSPDRLVPVVVLGGMTDFGGERAEHGVPCLDEPQLCCREPVGSERVQVPGSGAAPFDEPGCREDAQVLAHRRSADRKLLSKLDDRPRALVQKFEDPAPYRLSERIEYCVRALVTHK